MSISVNCYVLSFKDRMCPALTRNLFLVASTLDWSSFDRSVAYALPFWSEQEVNLSPFW